MNTEEIMALGLEMAGLTEVPADSGIAVPGTDVKKIMFGIDIDTADLLLACQLGVDLVIGHHPVTGSPAVSLYQVMSRQIEQMTSVGVPINKAQKALSERIAFNDRSAHPRNWNKTGQAAQLLNMPLMNIHMPLDIITENTVQAHLDRVLAPKSKLSDVIDALRKIPEYRSDPAGPVIRCGDKDDYAGKVYVSMAGGTNGGPEVMKAYFEAGIGTLVMMHVPEESLKAIKEQGIGNVVIAGHMRSDSIGINVLIKELEARGMEVIRMGGIIV